MFAYACMSGRDFTIKKPFPPKYTTVAFASFRVRYQPFRDSSSLVSNSISFSVNGVILKVAGVIVRWASKASPSEISIVVQAEKNKSDSSK